MERPRASTSGGQLSGRVGGGRENGDVVGGEVDVEGFLVVWDISCIQAAEEVQERHLRFQI